MTTLTLKNHTHIDTHIDMYMATPRIDFSDSTHGVIADIDSDNTAAGNANAWYDPRYNPMYGYNAYEGRLKNDFVFKKIASFTMGMNAMKTFKYQTQWTPFAGSVVYASYISKKFGTKFPWLYIRATGELVTTDSGYPPTTSASADALTFSKCSIGMLQSVTYWLKTTAENNYYLPTGDAFAGTTGYTREYSSAVVQL